MGEINHSQYERELDYLYSKYSGKSALDKKIEKAESILNSRQEAIERAKEKIIKSERVKKLKGKPLKDLSFAELDTMKSDGTLPDEFLTGELGEPDLGVITSKIISTCNALIPLLQSRNVSVARLPEGSSVQDVLSFVSYIRDQLKQQSENLDGLQIPIGETVDFEKWDKAYQDVKKTEFVLDYNIPDIASKGDTMIIKNDGTWERKPRYTKAELLETKREIESILRSYT